MGSSSGVGGGPNRAAMTNFDRQAADLIEGAQSLKADAAQAFSGAGDQMNQAGDRAVKAGQHLVGSIANAGMALGYVGKAGVWDGGQALGHGVAGTGAAIGGGAVYVAEEGAGGLGWLSQKASEGFAAIANGLNSWVGNGKTVTVSEVQGEGTDRTSAQIFEFAGEQYASSGEAFGAAWGSLKTSATHALAAGVNVGHVAGYTAFAAFDVIQAGVKTGEAGFLYAGSQLNNGAALAVQAAENGLEFSAELTEAAAVLTADLGNTLTSAKDGDQITVESRQAMEVYDAKIQELFNLNPALRELPAAKEYEAAKAADQDGN